MPRFPSIEKSCIYGTCMLINHNGRFACSILHKKCIESRLLEHRCIVCGSADTLDFFKFTIDFDEQNISLCLNSECVMYFVNKNKGSYLIVELEMNIKILHTIINFQNIPVPVLHKPSVQTITFRPPVKKFIVRSHMHKYPKKNHENTNKMFFVKSYMRQYPIRSRKISRESETSETDYDTEIDINI